MILVYHIFLIFSLLFHILLSSSTGASCSFCHLCNYVSVNLPFFAFYVHVIYLFDSVYSPWVATFAWWVQHNLTLPFSLSCAVSCLLFCVALFTKNWVLSSTLFHVSRDLCYPLRYELITKSLPHRGWSYISSSPGLHIFHYTSIHLFICDTQHGRYDSLLFGHGMSMLLFVLPCVRKIPPI